MGWKRLFIQPFEIEDGEGVWMTSALRALSLVAPPILDIDEDILFQVVFA